MDGLLVRELIYKSKYANAVELFVFDTRENMIKGICEWNTQRNGKYQIHNDFDAVTLENPPCETKNISGVEYLIYTSIFLNKEYLTPEIILHECSHAVFSLFRNILRYTSKFDKVQGTGNDEEEIFCYTLEEYFTKISHLVKEL